MTKVQAVTEDNVPLAEKSRIGSFEPAYLKHLLRLALECRASPQGTAV